MIVNASHRPRDQEIGMCNVASNNAKYLWKLCLRFVVHNFVQYIRISIIIGSDRRSEPNNFRPPYVQIADVNLIFKPRGSMQISMRNA